MDAAEAAYLRLLRAAGSDTEPTNSAVADACLTLPRDQAIATAERVRHQRAIMKRLLLDRGIEQRTPAWYVAREGLLTASDLAQALDRGKFGSRDDLLWAKVTRATKADPGPGEFDPFSWGVMFESVASRLYAESRGDVPVHEFGLLRHPTLACFGCSPDGVNELGVMMEIKVPARRKIDGTVAEQYFMQMQGQMEVCDLDECDFIELDVACYNDLAHMARDEAADPGRPRGAILIGPGKTYKYAPWGATAAKVAAWLAAEGVDVASRDRMADVRLWFQRILLVQRVKRDRAFWEDKAPAVQAFFDEVVRLRAEGATRPPKPARAARAPRVAPGDAPEVTAASFRAAFAAVKKDAALAKPPSTAPA